MRSAFRLALILLTVLVPGLTAARPAGAQQTSADLQLVKFDSPDPIPPGGTITYDIVLTNAGPDTSEFVSLEDMVPVGTTFVSFLATDPAWTCSTPMVGSAGGTVSCSIDALAADSSGSFTLMVAVDAGLATGTVITNTATASAETPDPDESFPSASTTTMVVTPPPTTDVSVTKVDDPDPVSPGSNLVYTLTVNNSGPADATSVSLVDSLPPETTFVSLAEPGGWTCVTPAVGTNDSVACSISLLAPGSAVFTLTVAVDAGVIPGSQIFNTATVAAENDLDESNNIGSTSTTVAGGADLSVDKVDTPDPVAPGGNITYTITLTNAGPSDAASVTLFDSLSGSVTFVSLAASPGWTCSTPPAGSTGLVSCSSDLFSASTSATFTLVVQATPLVTPGTTITNTATVFSQTVDPNPGNESATATTTVGSGSADLSVTKVDTPDPVNAGANLTYTLTVSNAGLNDAAVTLSDPLPAGTTFVSISSVAGWTCSTPPVGGTGTVVCSNPGFPASPANATFTLVVAVDAGVPAGTVLSNTATITSSNTSDPDPGDNAATARTTVVSSATIAGIPTLDTAGLALLALLLAMAGAWALRRSA